MPNDEPSPAGDPGASGRGPGRRRRAWLWGLGATGACAVAAVAALMIVSGWGYTPGPAPMPPKNFSVAASNVPDPVTGPVPKLGQAPSGAAAEPGPASAPDGGNGHAAGGTGSGRDRASASRSANASGATSKATARRQAPRQTLRDNTLVIPALGVNAPVGSSGIANGELVLPSDVAHTTEWDGSASIDGHTGTILVAGHVNNVDQGEGALWRLHLVRPGDAVYLVRDGTVTRWKITAVTAVIKSALPQNLFAGESGPRLLKLVTCGGKLEHTASGLGYYQDNVIATAVPF